MSRVLNAKERHALERMELDHASFHVKADLGTGIGLKTVDELLGLGLIEAGPSPRHYGQIGWRITPDGWRCMYGRTREEMMDGGQYRPLRVWQWPPK